MTRTKNFQQGSNVVIKTGKNQNSIASYSQADWEHGYESQLHEDHYWIEKIEGEIPVNLEGTLFRNGPGLTDVNGQKLHHPFDGDGMVCSFAFKNGRAYFRNRYVQTDGYLAEQAAGKILYRGVFGTQKPGGFLKNMFDLRTKNIANTNIIYWGEKLLALWEGGEPYRLDPATLETWGIDRLDGALGNGDAFAAHPRIEQRKNETDYHGDRLINFAVKPGLSTSITIYEFAQNGELLMRYTRYVPGFAFLHDMVITPNYCIFFQNPIELNPIPYLFGWRSAAQSLVYKGHLPTQILLIPRNGKDDVKILQTQGCFVFHHANAWQEDNQIYVDSICYESFPNVEPKADFRKIDFDQIPSGQLWRFKIDLETEIVEQRVIEERCCEFPTVHPQKVGKPYRYLYMGTAHNPLGNAPLQAIIKLDLKTGEKQLWSAAPRGFVSEPVFVPYPGNFDAEMGEDKGWLLSLVYDAASHRSKLVILDASNISQGPIACLHLKHHIPYSLHGSFTPQYFGPNSDF